MARQRSHEDGASTKLTVQQTGDGKQIVFSDTKTGVWIASDSWCDTIDKR